MNNKVGLGDLAKEVQFVILDSGSDYYGYLNSAMLYPPVSGCPMSIPGYILKADTNGFPTAATNTDIQVSGAVAEAHVQLHSITSVADHSSSASSGYILKADSNGLPITATNTDTDIAAVVADVKASGAVVSQVQIVSSNTETQIVYAMIPASLCNVGTSLNICAHGILQTKLGLPGSGTWRVRIGTGSLTGTTVASVVVASLPASLNNRWDCDFDATITATGSNGYGAGIGYVIGNIGTAGAFTYFPQLVNLSGTVDTIVQNICELTFQFGTSDIANILTCTSAIVSVTVK